MTIEDRRELVQGVMRGKISRRDFLIRALGVGMSASGVIAVLAACGGGGTSSRPAPPPGGKEGGTGKAFVSEGNKGEISIILWADTNNTYKEIIKSFTEETGIGVRYEVAPQDYLTWQQLMTTRLASGDTSTDAFHGDDFQVAMYGAAGWLEDLSPVMQEADIDLNDWPQQLIEVSSWDNTLYRIPWGGEAELFFYRTDFFEKAGIEPPDEWDWDQFLEIARDLTTGKQFGIALNGQKNGVLGNDIQKWTNQAGGAVNDLDNPGSRQALTFYKDLFARHKVAPPSSPQDDYTSNLQGFLSGKFAMWWVWDGLYSGIIEDKEFDKGQVGALLPPTGPENAQTTTACWGWNISKFSQKKELARQWVQYCAREETMKKLINAGRAPARISLLGEPEVHEKAPQSVFLEPLFKAGDLVKARPVTPSIQDVYDAAEKNIHAYLTDQIDLDTAVERAMAEITPVLERDG
jgi:ABC-type glycerol-3-phosphate transport system substrate-binding protein